MGQWRQTVTSHNNLWWSKSPALTLAMSTSATADCICTMSCIMPVASEACPGPRKQKNRLHGHTLKGQGPFSTFFHNNSLWSSSPGNCTTSFSAKDEMHCISWWQHSTTLHFFENHWPSLTPFSNYPLVASQNAPIEQQVHVKATCFTLAGFWPRWANGPMYHISVDHDLVPILNLENNVPPSSPYTG